LIPGQANGQYRYFRNGVLMAITEQWTARTTATSRHIKAERFAGDIRISVDSEEDADGFRHCRVDWQQQRPQGMLEIVAEYDLQQQSLALSCNGAQRRLPLEPPAGQAVFSPLMRIYTGWTIRALLDKGGNASVLVPWIRDPSCEQQLLTPLYSERQAQPRGEAVINIAGHHHSAREFEYSGGEYAVGTRFWLDENDLLLRYRWQQDDANEWEVVLHPTQTAP
jgi:hypothetical protein